jgi:hypothetical protein
MSTVSSTNARCGVVDGASTVRLLVVLAPTSRSDAMGGVDIESAPPFLVLTTPVALPTEVVITIGVAKILT